MIPIVEELRRRLPTITVAERTQGEGREHHDADAIEEEGMLYFNFMHVQFIINHVS